MLTENEIRPEQLMAEQARLFAEDVDRLMQHRSLFVTVACPACETRQFTFVFEKCGMPFVRCTQCETLYANPRPTPEQMADYYRYSKNYEYWSTFIFPASENVRREKIFKPRVSIVLELCERFQIPTDLLIEVGAGFGIFCEEMAKTNQFKRIIAVEPTPYLAKDCRQCGLNVIEKPIEQIETTLLLDSDEKISVIVSFEVIEHLFSPKAFLLKCADMLESGGILLLTCPNSKGFDIVTLGVHSSAVDVEHINLFHPQSLSLLMEQCGFEVIEKQTPGLLDAELVRKQLLSGNLSLDAHPFLKQVLIDEWDEKGQAFQQFLIDNHLSSNMLLVGRKR
jgi:2-polyprenyl-3-methyl-5-hydroxy-6-metoxy-1,4-benzoquinol methylase/ribosomal protein S27E